MHEMRFSDVAFIEGGLSGVGMGCQLQRQLRLKHYMIYERAKDLFGRFWI